MMASIINEMQSNDSSNIAKVQAWIMSYAETLGELAVSSSTKTETNKPTLQVVREKQTPLLISPPSQNITNTEKNHEVVDLKTYLMDLLNQVGETASAISSESIQHKNKAAELTRSLSSEKEKLRHANQQLTEQLETISVLRQKLAAAEEDVLILKQNVTQKDALIAEKKSEIAERIKMSDVLSRDRSKQVDEVLQRMASKIGVEYRDFQDAIAAPMNCDLGENLRLQLQSIFDILEKGGMKIK